MKSRYLTTNESDGIDSSWSRPVKFYDDYKHIVNSNTDTITHARHTHTKSLTQKPVMTKKYTSTYSNLGHDSHG